MCCKKSAFTLYFSVKNKKKHVKTHIAFHFLSPYAIHGINFFGLNFHCTMEVVPKLFLKESSLLLSDTYLRKIYQVTSFLKPLKNSCGSQIIKLSRNKKNSPNKVKVFLNEVQVNPRGKQVPQTNSDYLVGRNFVGRNFCRVKFSSL